MQFIPNMDGFPNGRRLEDDVVDIVLDVPLRGLVTRPAQPVRHRVEVSAARIARKSARAM